jgi:NAD(P)-dependent dehydrogenase (short-subunit alcohol dehydrogenase family)
MYDQENGQTMPTFTEQERSRAVTVLGMLRELAGKIAVVTGGASGIGKGIAGALVAEGMEVVIADVEEAALAASAGELGAVGIRTDVADAASVQALADEALERFGAVHVVCNNAGIGPFGRIADLTLADWRWIVDVNLWGVIHGVTTFLPLLERNEEGGHIVNTASMAGLAPVPRIGSYCVTKYGVVALSETLALELEQAQSKVGVSVLCPGPVRTNIKTSSRNRPAGLEGALRDEDLEQNPARQGDRWLEPEDVGPIVVDAIKRGELYAITHPEFFVRVEQRHERLVAAFERQQIVS